MSVTWSGRPAWMRGRARQRRVRFRDAVPVRRDRRDLRRQFRRAATAATYERQAQAIALLGRLAADRVPVSAVRPGARETERIIEFFDGTRVQLTARSKSGNLLRLPPGPATRPVWLLRAQPCYARHLFRLMFASAGHPWLLEVQATVGPALTTTSPC